MWIVWIAYSCFGKWNETDDSFKSTISKHNPKAHRVNYENAYVVGVETFQERFQLIQAGIDARSSLFFHQRFGNLEEETQQISSLKQFRQQQQQQQPNPNQQPSKTRLTFLPPETFVFIKASEAATIFAVLEELQRYLCLVCWNARCAAHLYWDTRLTCQ